MTKTEIINDTVRYYRSNPRGYSNKLNGCIYQKDGMSCAIGRFFNSKATDEIRGFDGAAEDLEYHLEVKYKFPNLDSILKVIVHGHSLEFWTDLQILHDTASYWEPCVTKGGLKLSTEGIKHRDEMLVKYKGE